MAAIVISVIFGGHLDAATGQLKQILIFTGANHY